MESVTRPVGHLPPSVYWRRRAIVLVGLAVLIALVAWACTAGGGGDGKDDKKNASAESTTSPPSSPAPGPIGPGPTGGTNPGASTGQPGAAAGGNPGGTGGANTGGSGAPSAGNGTNTGAPGGNPAGGATGGQPGAPGAATGGSQPQQPRTTIQGMLACTYPGNAQLVVTGDRPQDTKFRVGEQVKLTLEVRNVGTETCAVDMAQKSATVEIRSGADRIWSPADCAPAQPEITQIQPGKSVSRTWTWNWTRSDPGRCSGPAPGLASPPPGSLFAAAGKVNGMQWASKDYQWLVAQ